MATERELWELMYSLLTNFLLFGPVAAAYLFVNSLYYFISYNSRLYTVHDTEMQRMGKSCGKRWVSNSEEVSEWAER